MEEWKSVDTYFIEVGPFLIGLDLFDLGKSTEENFNNLLGVCNELFGDKLTKVLYVEMHKIRISDWKVFVDLSVVLSAYEKDTFF